MRVEGSVCRRANRSLISPSRVQIDHLSGTGGLIETSYAYLPRLSQREDQRCGRYGAKLKTASHCLAIVVRVCLPRGHGPCTVSQADHFATAFSFAAKLLVRVKLNRMPATNAVGSVPAGWTMIWVSGCTASQSVAMYL